MFPAADFRTQLRLMVFTGLRTGQIKEANGSGGIDRGFGESGLKLLNGKKGEFFSLLASSAERQWETKRGELSQSTAEFRPALTTEFASFDQMR
jgi:hypothetical protein